LRVSATVDLFHRALYIKGGHRYGSLIVAAALLAGWTWLYSEDFQHEQQIEGLTIRDPFSS